MVPPNSFCRLWSSCLEPPTYFDKFTPMLHDAVHGHSLRTAYNILGAPLCKAVNKMRTFYCRSTLPTCWRQSQRSLSALRASTHCDFVVRRPRLKVVERAFSVAAPRVCGTNYRPTWSCVAQQHRSGAKSKLPCSHRRTSENNIWATTMWCALCQPVEGAIQDTALTVTVSDCMVHVYNLCAVL